MTRKTFSGAFAFAVSQALSSQVDIREFAGMNIQLLPSTDLVSGVLFRPEISHTTESSDFAAILTSTGGTAVRTPSTGGITRWVAFDKDFFHYAGSYARLHAVTSTGGDKTSTGAYSIPYMGKD